MQLESRARFKFWLLAVVSLLGAVACSGPRGATPLPEPPALDPRRIGLPELMAAAYPSFSIVGSKGAAPANAVVRVTNLDSTTALPIATTASGDGAFMLTVNGDSGTEVRLQALLDGQRSAPLDFIFTSGTPPTLTPSPRHACVSLSPGFELAFDMPETRTLTLHNACAAALDVSNPRTRLGVTAFNLTTALPLQLAPAGDTALGVASTAGSGSGDEDVLFLDLTIGGGALRYPITLVAP